MSVNWEMLLPNGALHSEYMRSLGKECLRGLPGLKRCKAKFLSHLVEPEPHLCMMFWLFANVGLPFPTFVAAVDALSARAGNNDDSLLPVSGSQHSLIPGALFQRDTLGSCPSQFAT